MTSPQCWRPSIDTASQRAEARSKTSPIGILRSNSPSPDCRKTTAAGRSPGSRVNAWRTAFPVVPCGASQWLMVRGSPLTVAGAARAFTRFPLNPLSRNLSQGRSIQVVFCAAILSLPSWRVASIWEARRRPTQHYQRQPLVNHAESARQKVLGGSGEIGHWHKR